MLPILNKNIKIFDSVSECFKELESWEISYAEINNLNNDKKEDEILIENCDGIVFVTKTFQIVSR